MEVSIGIIAWEKLLALTFKIKVVHAFQPNNICRYAPSFQWLLGLVTRFHKIREWKEKTSNVIVKDT